MIHFDHRDRRPLYSQICDSFRQQILSGILRKGDQLPSVRELATTLSINPNTIQRAYRELEGQGLIYSVAGKGSFVTSEDLQSEERQALLEQLDRLTGELTRLGLSRQQIADHILKGENDHA